MTRGEWVAGLWVTLAALVVALIVMAATWVVWRTGFRAGYRAGRADERVYGKTGPPAP